LTILYEGCEFFGQSVPDIVQWTSEQYGEPIRHKNLPLLYMTFVGPPRCSKKWTVWLRRFKVAQFLFLFEDQKSALMLKLKFTHGSVGINPSGRWIVENNILRRCSDDIPV
jgi:hypothetical protein